MLNHQVRQQPDRMSRGISRQTVNSCLYEWYMHHAFETQEWIPWEIFFLKYHFPRNAVKINIIFSRIWNQWNPSRPVFILMHCLVSDFDWMASIWKPKKVNEIVRSIGLFISCPTAARIWKTSFDWTEIYSRWKWSSLWSSSCLCISKQTCLGKISK